jgi:hypothetical protein
MSIQIYVQRKTVYKDDAISDVQLEEKSKKSRASHRRLKPSRMNDGKPFTP